MLTLMIRISPRFRTFSRVFKSFSHFVKYSKLFEVEPAFHLRAVQYCILFRDQEVNLG